jgi:transcriptional regulator with XRE-family HTH domain
MFQLTLRAARLNFRMTIAEVSVKTGIPARTIRRYEKDCGNAKRELFCQLINLYGISVNHVWIGKEDDCNKVNQGIA